jgi:sodium/bile acid cotransporter 7
MERESNKNCIESKFAIAKTFIIENFLLVGFCGAVLVAFAYPLAGKLFYSWTTADFHIIELINNCFVFFISGVTLKLEELKPVFKYKIPIVYSLVMINLGTTLLSFGLIRLPYLTRDFAVGVTIFATVPTTLGSYLFFLLCYLMHVHI